MYSLQSYQCSRYLGKIYRLYYSFNSPINPKARSLQYRLRIEAKCVPFGITRDTNKALIYCPLYEFGKKMTSDREKYDLLK